MRGFSPAVHCLPPSSKPSSSAYRAGNWRTHRHSKPRAKARERHKKPERVWNESATNRSLATVRLLFCHSVNSWEVVAEKIMGRLKASEKCRKPAGNGLAEAHECGSARGRAGTSRPCMKTAPRGAVPCSIWQNSQTKYCPPLADRVEPVMKPASSEARKTTQRATSEASPRRPTGICAMIASRTFSGTAMTMSVAI